MRKVPVFDLCVGTYGQGIQIMERGRIPDMKYIVNTWYEKEILRDMAKSLKVSLREHGSIYAQGNDI